MKIQKPNSTIIVIFVAAAAALFAAGCAEMQSGNTTSLLTAAGFRARTPQTPKQQELYAALPPYKVEHATVKGRAFYVYKDRRLALPMLATKPTINVIGSSPSDNRSRRTTTWPRK